MSKVNANVFSHLLAWIAVKKHVSKIVTIMVFVKMVLVSVKMDILVNTVTLSYLPTIVMEMDILKMEFVSVSQAGKVQIVPNSNH